MYFHNFKLTYEDYLDIIILNYYVKTKMYKKGILKFLNHVYFKMSTLLWQPN